MVEKGQGAHCLSFLSFGTLSVIPLFFLLAQLESHSPILWVLVTLIFALTIQA